MTVNENNNFVKKKKEKWTEKNQADNPFVQEMGQLSY